MEEVYDWLRKYGLGIYSPTFQENGWDNLLLLPYMTEVDLGICIAKRGDIARFKNSVKKTIQSVVNQRVRRDENCLFKTISTDTMQADNSEDKQLALHTHSYRLPGHVASIIPVNGNDEVLCVSQPQRNQVSGPTECHIGFSAQTTVYKNSPTYIYRGAWSDKFTAKVKFYAKRYEENKHLFIETEACKEIKSILEKSECDQLYWVTLLGRPGDGKTTILNHLMVTNMNKGYQPILLSSPDDWRDFIACYSDDDEEKRLIFIIDDMFGTPFLDRQKFSGWLSLIGDMQVMGEEMKDRMFVICASRSYIFADVETALAIFKAFQKYLVVDMTKPRLRLSPNDQVEMFNKYADYYGFPENENEIARVDPPHGFPHCVALYSQNFFLRQKGIISFFSNPSECVRKEIRNFREYDTLKYLVLLLLLLSNGRLEANFIESVIIKPSVEQRRILQFYGASSEKDIPEIFKAVNALKNRYLIQTSEGFYSFTHESLKENVGYEFISQNPSLAIDILDFKYISEYFCFSKTKTKSVDKPPQCVPDDSFRTLVRRIEKEILKGNIAIVSICDVWNYVMFLDKWMHYITNDLSTPELERVLCSSNDNQEGRCNVSRLEDPQSLGYCCDLSDTILESLANFGKYDAIAAMLHHMKIKKIMQERKREKILQHTVDHIGSSSEADISVLKTLFEVLRESGNIPDVTIALKNALTMSDVKSLILLTDGNHVRKNFVDETGRNLFHYLVESNIDLFSFQKVCGFLFDRGMDINLGCTKISSGKTPLYVYIYNILQKDEVPDDFETKIKYLCKMGSNINLVHTETRQGVLHMLVTSDVGYANFERIFICLVECGIDIDIRDESGSPPLHYCFYDNKPTIDFAKRCVCLIRNGAKIKELDYEAGNFLLEILKVYKTKTCIEILQQISEYISNFKIVDENGENAMHYLFTQIPVPETLDLFTFLISAGVTYNRLDDKQRLPVMHALQNGCEMSLLSHLIRGSPPKIRDMNGKGYFHYLCKSKFNLDNFRRLCKLLMENDEDINLKDSKGIPPIFEACSNESFSWKYIQSLHGYGANITTKDNYGRNIAVFALLQDRDTPDDICQLLRYVFTATAGCMVVWPSDT